MCRSFSALNLLLTFNCTQLLIFCIERSLAARMQRVSQINEGVLAGASCAVSNLHPFKSKKALCVRYVHVSAGAPGSRLNRWTTFEHDPSIARRLKFRAALCVERRPFAPCTIQSVVRHHRSILALFETSTLPANQILRILVTMVNAKPGAKWRKPSHSC